MTFTITLTFSYEINSSAQVGDEVYWTAIDVVEGFGYNGPAGVVTHIGVITSINNFSNTITVVSPHTVTGTTNPLPGVSPPLGYFISFSQNNIVNNNELKGYYASAQFVNNSKVKAELFSVGSGVSESSK